MSIAAEISEEIRLGKPVRIVNATAVYSLGGRERFHRVMVGDRNEIIRAKIIYNKQGDDIDVDWRFEDGSILVGARTQMQAAKEAGE